MLTVPAIPSSLSLIRRHVATVAEQAKLDRQRAYRLRLAVDEIVTNIVMHGYGNQGGKERIDLWTWHDRHTLNIVVEDTAPPYVPDFQPLVALDHQRIEQGLGGLGLFLAQANVDQLMYDRRHGRNRHTFQVRRTLPAHPTYVAPPSVVASS